MTKDVELMKVNRLETHDRYEHIVKQGFSISDCCQDIINQRPFGRVPFYIFAHARTEDNGVDKRLIWQPRLTKPKCQPNSMLFKVHPGSDNVKIIWILPAPELFNNFRKGLLTESSLVADSIHKYKTDPGLLEAKEDDDLDDASIEAIYKSMSRNSELFKPI